MTLIGWELKKICRRRLTRAVLAVSLLLAAGSALMLGFANLGFGEEIEAPTWQARARVVQATADAGTWHGPLTTETLRAARDRCKAALATEDDALDNADAYIPGDILYTAALVYTDAGIIPWQDWPARITALDDETFDRWYALQEEAVDRTIAAAPAAWQPTLRALNERVPRPFVYDWVDGHYTEIVQLGNVAFVVGLLLCAALAPLFCGEVRSGVAAITHCTRHGRGRLARAKLAAALLFAGGAFALVCGVFVAIQLALFGVRGLSASLQLTAVTCVMPLNYGQAEALLLLDGLLSCLAGAALTAALSAWLDSEPPVLLVLFAVLVFLRGMAAAGMLGFLPELLRQALPFLTTLQQYLDNRLLVLPGGLIVPLPFYQMAVQPLYLVVLLPLAGRRFARRQVG